MIIELEDAKAHLNITEDDDDTLITSKIAAAEAFVAPYVSVVSIEADYPDGAPEPIKEAIRQLVAALYENREATLVGQSGHPLPFGFWDLIAPYRLMSF